MPHKSRVGDTRRLLLPLRETKELAWSCRAVRQSPTSSEPGPVGGRCSPESAHLGWEDIVSHVPDLGAQAWELRHGQTLEFHRHAADEAARGLVALFIDKHPPTEGLEGQRGQSLAVLLRMACG